MEDRIPLLEKPGATKDDGDEDFDPFDETVESHQDFDFDLETLKTSIGLDKLKELEINKKKAIKIIMKRFPNYNPQKSSFTAIINELGKVSVFLGRINAREYPLFINDEINPDLPSEIVLALGSQEEVEMWTPKTSTGRETLRPKKFKEGDSQWGPVKTPQLKKNITGAMETVEENFPNLNRSKLEEFNVNINEFGKITIKGISTNAATHNLFNEDGDINEKIPVKIKEILGKQISNKGLRDQLEIAKERKKHYKKSFKKMEELIKTKDDEIKLKDDEIKEKEKETERLQELENFVKIKDNELDSMKDELLNLKLKEAEKGKEKDSEVVVIKQMSARDMEEAKKEIIKITNEFKLEREKKINAEKKLESEKKNLAESQKRISSLERGRVKMEHDIKEIKESGTGFNQKLVRENEELLKKLEESEQLTNDMADMTQEKIMKSVVEVEESKNLEAEAIANLERMGNRITVLENRNEVEVANARRELNKLTSERNNAQRSLEVMKNEVGDRNADFNREIQRLAEHINDLEQEKAINEERFRVLSEQLEQEKAVNLERIRVLSEQLERTDIGENVRSNIEREREILGERNNELDAQVEREREEIEERNSEIEVELEGDPERMSLREKIKSIFKKYGFTVTAILLSISAIVATIVTNSLSAVSKMAKGVANGLKDIGKKLAQILPGMIGAIASFIFRTAGEVIGFLAKNAWLLIVAVVVYFVENLKKKKRR